MSSPRSQRITIEKEKGRYLLYQGTALDHKLPSITHGPLSIKQLFDPALLKARRLTDKIARGRGETFFFHIDETALVLRHYHRGGLAATVSRDRYLWLGLRHTRAYRELVMLLGLSANQLPVPRPFAARVIREGYCYRADIITHTLTDTETLGQRLQHGPIDDTGWRKIGATIAAFHKQGVYHADLNADNILLNSHHHVFIIDFDKACFRDPNHIWWRHHNLQRLKRSLIKYRKQRTVFYTSDANWIQLEKGYDQA